MLNHARTLRSGLRFVIGGLRIPRAIARGRAVDHFDLITIDIFATLLQRCGEDDDAWREGAQQFAKVIDELGLRMNSSCLEFRRTVEADISAQMIASGRDPEFSHELVFEQMLTRVGHSKPSLAASDLARWEFQRELANTQQIAERAQFVRDSASRGRRIVAVSDSRYSGKELEELLNRHSIHGISKVYSSADFGMSKFSGNLFDEVSRAENVSKSSILHIGDDIFTDALSPSQRGIAVRRVKKPSRSSYLLAPPVRVDHQGDDAYQLGYDTLGPVLVAFTRLLFESAKRDGVEHLAFVARDGELLLRVARTLPSDYKPELSYLEISRRAMACTSITSDLWNVSTDKGDSILAPLRNIRSLGSFIEQFQTYYGLPPELVQQHSLRLGLQKGDREDAHRLLGDSTFISELQNSLQSQLELVLGYLRQEKVVSNQTALVDIGWRGSLQKSIMAKCNMCGLAAPKGYYFGMWNEDSKDFPQHSVGLISDQRRGRNILESSAWHCAFLLEAVCRAKHGMVKGFRKDSDGQIRATYVDSGEAREAEEASEDVQARIQEGVIDYALWYSKSIADTKVDTAAIRRGSQLRLRQLAFFPTKRDIAVGRKLIYSEPTSDDQALPLILPISGGLKNIAKGFRSPWKAGFMQAVGGRLFTLVYTSVEWLFCVLPVGTKSAIRRILLRS